MKGGTLKSQVSLFRSLLEDCGVSCGTDTSRDWKYINRRLGEEGFEFLSLTLPQFEKDLLVALEQRQITSDLFLPFGKRGGLPKLFSGFLRQVFSNDGSLRPDISVNAVRCVRQLCCFYAKIETACSPSRVAAAVDTYVLTDGAIDNTVAPPDGLVNIFSRLYGKALYKIDAILQNPSPGELPFSHGPGATAEKLSANGRWKDMEWNSAIEAVFPKSEFFCSSYSDYLSTEDVYAPEVPKRPVRVVTVPKTQKGPRVIAVEPACMMFVQQGLFRMLEAHLRRLPTWRLFNWKDQTSNQELARTGVSRRFATLDLSEASDRVSLRLVTDLFAGWPHLLRAILACRSEQAQLPNGRIINLRKFASMGSALCFPIESMVFLAIVLYSMESAGFQLGPYLTSSSSELPARVYGDDICVPVDYVPCVIRGLEAMGLKVNRHKSFWNGKFRESCGADWYDGEWVTPIRCRTTLPTTFREGKNVLSAVELHNALLLGGYVRAAAHLEGLLIGFLGRRCYAPVGTLPGSLWTEDATLVDRSTRYNRRYFRLEARSVVDCSKPPRDELGDYGALRKYFVLGGRDFPVTDAEHLLRAGRPRSVATKIGWRAL